MAQLLKFRILKFNSYSLDGSGEAVVEAGVDSSAAIVVETKVSCTYNEKIFLNFHSIFYTAILDQILNEQFLLHLHID